MIRLIFATLMLQSIALPPASAQTAISENDIVTYRKMQAAAYRDDADRIEIFAKEGEDLEAADPNGRTPILIAAHRSALKALQALVDAGANINARDDEGFDAFTIAAANNDNALQTLVLKDGIDLSIPGGKLNDTALGLKAREGDVETTTLLINAGSPLNYRNDLGETALLQAVKYGDGGKAFQKIVQLLLDAGAKPGKKDNEGIRARQYAKQLGYDEILQIFKDNKS